MSRESAYRLRRRASGRAFATAWDAALLLARQRLIDDVFELAFTGSVVRTVIDGEVMQETTRRDARTVLATVERLGSVNLLCSAPTVAVAEEFDSFLDCLETDVEAGEASPHGSRKTQVPSASAEFIATRMDFAGLFGRQQMDARRHFLARAALAAKPSKADENSQ